MTEGEKLLIDDLNEFVRQSADILDEQQSTGIRPPPVIETTEQSLATTRFGLELSPEPVAQTGPEQPICGGGGACCHGTWPALECDEVESEAECDALGGNFFPGQTCAEVNCNLGACCQFDGGCSNVEDFLCLAERWHGYGTECYSTRCEGVCALCQLCLGPHNTCEVSGTPFDCGYTCYDNLTFPECQELFNSNTGIAWLLETEEGATCGELGACDFFSGCCAHTQVGSCCDGECNCADGFDQETCLGFGGTYWNEDCGCPFSGIWPETCGISYPGCETGACCLDLAGTCTEQTYSDCIGLGGFFVGGNTSCPNAVCEPYPYGACCVEGHDCEVVSSVQCDAWGGTFHAGDCDPDPC